MEASFLAASARMWSSVCVSNVVHPTITSLLHVSACKRIIITPGQVVTSTNNGAKSHGTSLANNLAPVVVAIRIKRLIHHHSCCVGRASLATAKYSIIAKTTATGIDFLNSRQIKMSRAQSTTVDDIFAFSDAQLDQFMRKHHRPDGSFELPIAGWDELSNVERDHLAKRLQ
jgi:hypothetical protein